MTVDASSVASSADNRLFTVGGESVNGVVVVRKDTASFGCSIGVVAPQSLVPIDFQGVLFDSRMVPLLEEEIAVYMAMNLRLEPDYVSFEKVFLKEGDCPASNIWGVFAPWPSALLPHDAAAGAWREVGVHSGNITGYDIGGARLNIAGVWTPGGFQYNITNYWYVKNDEIAEDMHVMNVEPMIFNFYANGDLSVSKYGCAVTRGTNNVIRTTGGGGL